MPGQPTATPLSLCLHALDSLDALRLSSVKRDMEQFQETHGRAFVAYHAYSVGVLCQAVDYVPGMLSGLEQRIRKAAGLLARVPVGPDYPIWAPGWSDLAIKVWGTLEVLAVDENGERENEPEFLTPDALTRTAEDVLKPIASALRHWEFQEKGLRRTTLWVALGRVDCLRHLMMPRTYEPPEYAGGYSRLLEALKHFGMLSPKTEEVVHAVEVAGLYREEAPLSVPPEGLLIADEELLIEGLHCARVAAESELGQALEQDAVQGQSTRGIGTPPDAMEAIRIARTLEQKPQVELHEASHAPPAEGQPAGFDRTRTMQSVFGEGYGIRHTEAALQAEDRWAAACHRELDRTEKAILDSLGRDSLEETRRLIQAHFEEQREQVYDRVAFSRGREGTVSSTDGDRIAEVSKQLFEAAFRFGRVIGKTEE